MNIYAFPITNLIFFTIGIIIFTLTRGDELDVCIRATRDLFRNQEEIDTFTKIYYGQILDRYYYLCQNA